MSEDGDETETESDYQPDGLDRVIIYALMADARNLSPARIAEEENVTPATIRNRINRLENQNIISSYPAQIDFEQINGQLTALFSCSVPIENQGSIAQQVQDISGVINVRELLRGQMNLHVTAIGSDLNDFYQIAQSLIEIGGTVEDIVFVQNESFCPYQPFQPNERH